MFLGGLDRVGGWCGSCQLVGRGLDTRRTLSGLVRLAHSKYGQGLARRRQHSDRGCLAAEFSKCGPARCSKVGGPLIHVKVDMSEYDVLGEFLGIMLHRWDSFGAMAETVLE